MNKNHEILSLTKKLPLTNARTFYAIKYCEGTNEEETGACALPNCNICPRHLFLSAIFWPFALNDV